MFKRGNHTNHTGSVFPNFNSKSFTCELIRGWISKSGKILSEYTIRFRICGVTEDTRTVLLITDVVLCAVLLFDRAEFLD